LFRGTAGGRGNKKEDDEEKEEEELDLSSSSSFSSSSKMSVSSWLFTLSLFSLLALCMPPSLFWVPLNIEEEREKRRTALF
jgi:hypothetical protein